MSQPIGISAIERLELERIIDIGLKEDVGSGDITTESTIPVDLKGEAKFLAKDDGVLSGLSVAELAFKKIDPEVIVRWSHCDGDSVSKGTVFGSVSGRVRSILAGERLALNLLQRASGIATATRRLVDVIPVTSKTKLLDTRKTAPGLRMLDKMAVRHGGALNHRYALYDMVLIKDNHIDASGGSITRAVASVRKHLQDRGLSGTIKIEVETRNMSEVAEAVNLSPPIDRIMLDNMVKVDAASGYVDVSRLKEAVEFVGGRVPLEASGNINAFTLPAIAQTGVDFASVGAITCV